ncbi:MAG: hypothetical protein BWY04_01066 [candidate division CPR1 bacterium ADurb.Bin160]|uniref:Uncharacterized protein n=1 Tax=candidate division CPR1 bacterium ADurb.Bin160 TaxID=1852826 RepID=A0A1V5ZLV6_9BACT|nr:MAG: hypothetical protein BWY04_01066 [candidate division CPR1 bacterium ADurb.Bin160]
MFTQNDFWKILELLTKGEVEDLDTITKAIAESERSKTQSYFETIVDQICFRTSDQLRLRELLINWYSSIKSLITISKSSSDVFSLPSAYLDELFRSFGYPCNLDRLTNLTKAYFFLDLVNMYKVKGTPFDLYKVLNYYGLGEIDIVEFWLMKNEKSNLVFRAKEVYPDSNIYKIPVTDIPFETLIKNDPHWLLTKETILRKNKTSIINLPSKSPYFAIRARNLITNLLKGILVLMNELHKEYEEWESTGTLEIRDIEITHLKIRVSLLELFLSCCYIFKKMYDEKYGSDKIIDLSRYLCYNGELTDFNDIYQEYDSYIYTRPNTRTEQKEKLEEFTNLFYRPMTENFLRSDTNIGDLLYQINPSLKLTLDEWPDFDRQTILFSYLINDLSDWLKYTANMDSPYLTNWIYGNIFDDLKEVINFFKPYRARLAGILDTLLFDARLGNTIIVEDDLKKIEVTQRIVDFNTPNSIPCCIYPEMECEDSTATFYSRETYDCGSKFDIGSCDDRADYDFNITEEIYDVYICRPYDEQYYVGGGVVRNYFYPPPSS